MLKNDDDDNDDECSSEDQRRVAGYLRQFIENGKGLLLVNESIPSHVYIVYEFIFICLFTASSPELKALVKFWVGWEVPTTSLKLEVTHSNLPKASTCFETLRLPSRYEDFQTFKKEFLACISTVDTGFGLV